ncbi:MAG: glycosyltransferase family 2 protein, partial [Planctomycetota bacterium]
GNRFASWMMRAFWRAPYTDLGPFRAIRYDQLLALGMVDRDYGWTIEMQLKALKRGLRIREVPVPYRRRIGQSKISGTVRGSIAAGTKILWCLARYGFGR